MKNYYVLLFVLVLMWGLSWPINKVGLFYTSPTTYIALRFLIATIIMFAVVIVRKQFVLPMLRDLPLIFTMGLFQMGLTMNFASYGLSLSGAGRATFIVFTVSIWISPLAALFFKERMQKLSYLSVLLGLAGIILMMSPWNIDWSQKKPLLGDGCLFLGSISWAIGILCSRRLKWHRTQMQLFPWQLLLAFIFTGTVVWISGVDVGPKMLNFPFISSLVYTGIVSTVIGFWIMMIVSRHLPSGEVSFGILWCPLISLITSCLFLGEKVSFSVIAAVILIMAGIGCHILSERKPDLPSVD